MVFIFAEVFAEQAGKRVDKMENFLAAKALRKGLGKFFFTGNLQKAGEGFFIKILGEAKAHLIWLYGHGDELR